MLKVGDQAPEFELQSDGGETVRLRDLRGKKVILYFYPKDDTPGCTTEACEFRDRAPQIEREGAVVLGVSPDSVASHDKFKAKYELPFALLSDPDHVVAKKYGAWGAKKMYGKTYQGILRTTFVIDERGKIEEVFEKVKAKGHADQVVRALGG
ncbi:MAG: thioredoxin-dependent thiol peroxidase [Gemmatimonadota bacterium]|nr:MAG: thioredoxin-dependent thiol peroxidase [Gemmatimonadota bacterium]